MRKEIQQHGGRTSPSPFLFAVATLTLIFLSVLMSSGDDSNLSKDSVSLHSEWSPLEQDEPSDYFFSEELRNEIQNDEDEHWLVTEWRNLKRGGSSSSSRSSSSKNRSYGNCYGDRCDDIGGDQKIAIIIGSIVGGCCFFCLCYALYQWIKKKRHQLKKKRRRKNKVGVDGGGS